MLGAAGFIIPEAFNKFGANCGPEAVWFKVCNYSFFFQFQFLTLRFPNFDELFIIMGLIMFVYLTCKLQTGALLLDGNTLNYFGKNIPINLAVAIVAEVVLVGGAEYYRIINGLVLYYESFTFLVLLLVSPTGFILCFYIMNHV